MHKNASYQNKIEHSPISIITFQLFENFEQLPLQCSIKATRGIQSIVYFTVSLPL